MKIEKSDLKLGELRAMFPTVCLDTIAEAILRELADKYVDSKYKFDCGSYKVHRTNAWYIEKDNLENLVSVEVNISVEDKKAVYKKAKELGVKLGGSWEKYGYVMGDGSPRTSYSQKVELEENVIIKLSYTKKELPSSKCRVVDQVNKTLVCDI
jgi:hypothetical protein